MEADLRTDIGIAEQATSARYAAHLLQELVGNSNPAVAETACIVLADRYDGQSGCLKDISDLAPEAVARVRVKIAEREVHILRALETNPMQGLVATDSRAEVLDRFELLREHPNGRIHRLACQAIDRYYPEKHVEHCSPN